MKEIKRITFYTRKAAACITPHRRNRLIAYREVLSRRLEAKGFQWRPAIELGRESV